MKTSLRLLLLGYGNVAQALIPLLASRSAWFVQHLGTEPEICGLGSRRNGFFVTPGGIPVSKFAAGIDPLALVRQTGQACVDASAFLRAGQNAGATMLLELTTLNPENGEPALTYIRAALEAGMDVVTANKGPIAHAGTALHALARSRGTQLRYESAVMDGLPLLNLAEFTLPTVGILGFRGLLNTTSSIVLRQMELGTSQAEAIALAQQIGVAEANPWYDLDGWDATMKTTILANTLLAVQLTPATVQRTGIRDLTQDEIIAASQAGTPIRLVSSAQLVDGVPVAQVRPERLLPADPLHMGKDSGLVLLETEAMGRITLIEHDMDVIQTAYGVLSDIIAVNRGKQAQ